MIRIYYSSLAALVVISLSTSPAVAGFTTVDVSSYVNSNITANAQTIPVGLSLGNQGTAIPFNIAQYPAGSGVAGTWNPDYLPGNYVGSPIVGDTLTINLISYNIKGQSSFYALLNNYFGTPNANEYNVTITATNGDNVTYESIGGVDTRDYNSNTFTNTIANTTTAWFNNGIGQRLDVREFTLPANFFADTIASFTITQVTQGNNGDAAVFSGLTFSTQTAQFGVPEPSSLLMVSVGLVGLSGVFRHRRRSLLSKARGNL